MPRQNYTCNSQKSTRSSIDVLTPSLGIPPDLQRFMEHLKGGSCMYLWGGAIPKSRHHNKERGALFVGVKILRTEMSVMSHCPVSKPKYITERVS